MTTTASAFVQSIFHPNELISLVKYSLHQRHQHQNDKVITVVDEGHEPDTLDRCYHYLRLTSRSFSTVIQALHPQLRDAICIFYLTLRGLDTIEDDMTIPISKKLNVMKEFPTYLYTRGWTYNDIDINDKDRDLLVHFNVVIDQFLRLPESYRDIIFDINTKMANGMADYCLRAYNTEQQQQQQQEKEISIISSSVNNNSLRSGNRVISINDYDQYCHYVAGLVGHGLTRLFLASNLESSPLLGSNSFSLANSMGLFLQKINITRDVFEDYNQNRVFWPRDIWGNYASNLDELLDPKDNYIKGRAALNHMCYNALTHVPDVLTYMKELKEDSVFRFCAIPQVMAIATLALLYNNSNVMNSTIKIRKGLAVYLMMQSNDFTMVQSIFSDFIMEIRTKAHKYMYELNHHHMSLNTTALNTIRTETNHLLVLCDTILKLIRHDDMSNSNHSNSSIITMINNPFMCIKPNYIRFALSVTTVPLATWFIYKRYLSHST